MYANIIKLIWVETPSNRGSPFSVFCQTDQIICRFECQFELFSDQIRHFESQFGNMDDLLLAFAYNVKTTHFQPSSNKVLQPRKRWDVLCRIIRECQESNFYNYLTFEKIQFAQRTHSNGIMENEHRRFCTYLQSQGCSMLKLRKMVNQKLLLHGTQSGRLYTHIPPRNLVSALQTLVTRTDTTSILLIRKSLQHVNVIIHQGGVSQHTCVNIKS